MAIIPTEAKIFFHSHLTVLSPMRKASPIFRIPATMWFFKGCAANCQKKFLEIIEQKRIFAVYACGYQADAVADQHLVGQESGPGAFVQRKAGGNLAVDQQSQKKAGPNCWWSRSIGATAGCPVVAGSKTRRDGLRALTR